MTEVEKQVLAFSAICQAAACTQQLARRGSVVPEEASLTLVNSSLVLDAPNAESIFGGLDALKVGLQVLIDQLAGGRPKDVEQTQYVVRMLHLERLLNKKPAVQNELGKRLTQVQRQRDQLQFEQVKLNESLASVYTDLVSPLGPKIQIQGSPAILRNTGVQQHIRALLLGGVRSSVLWRQLGGKRRHLLFKRQQLLKAANSLLQQCKD